MRKFVLQVLASLLSLYLCAEFIPGVEFRGPVKIFLLIGIVLGFINTFLKPILDFITLPLKLLTFGLFGVVINMVIIWVLANVIFPENLFINSLFSLLIATIVIYFINSIFLSFRTKPKL